MACCPCMQPCNTCVTPPATTTRCCKCYLQTNIKPCCASYNGSGWTGACTGFNALFQMSAMGGTSDCYWACHSSPLLADLQYHSVGDYWEFRLSKDDGATFTTYRLAGASFNCTTSNTFSLFAAGPCPSPPATVQVDSTSGCCALQQCDYASSPGTLHASFSADCALLNGITVTITKQTIPDGPHGYEGNIQLSNGSYFFVRLWDYDQFFNGCPFKRLTVYQQTQAPPCDPVNRGCCYQGVDGISIMTADCSTQTCNPYYVHFTNGPIHLCTAEPCHDSHGNCITQVFCTCQITVTQ
jgi:hypothetical protein